MDLVTRAPIILSCSGNWVYSETPAGLRAPAAFGMLTATSRALRKVKPLHGWKSLTKHLARAVMEVLNRFWQPQPLLQVQGGRICRYGALG